MDTHSTSDGLPGVSARGFELLTTAPGGIAIAVVVAFLLLHTLTPRLDPREPPLIKPRIPLIGHIIGMIRQQAQYHITLQRATRHPIATLPMLTGKMYVVFDPHLIAAGLRNKALSTNPHVKEVAPVACQLSSQTAKFLHTPAGDHLVDRVMTHTIPKSFAPDSLQRLNAAALLYLADQLSTLARASSTSSPGDYQTIPNVWLYIRRLITAATAPAIYGPAHDPLSTSPAVESALWDFERNLLNLSLGLPTRQGSRARKVLFDALVPYYSGLRDEDPHNQASDFVRNRARELRDAGIPEEDIARLEVMLPFAALANTVPLLFWLVGLVFSRPELAGRLREEAEAGLVMGKEEDGEGVVTVTVRAGAVVEEKCPRLMSAYRETLRCTVHQVSTRTALQDTVLVGKDGREYLLKKDSVVQMSIGTSHALEEYWGADVDQFNPERFLDQESRKAAEVPGSAKARRTAFQPFGGGTHLCPGRHFAFAEIMAVMATLLLGYELEPLDGPWKLPAFATRSVIDAVTKPAKHGEGFGVKIRRRPGWENVIWKYEL